MTLARALQEVAADVSARVERCHEVVACPKCGAPIGERCVRVVRGHGYGHGGAPGWTPPPLKHSHRERWTLLVPAR